MRHARAIIVIFAAMAVVMLPAMTQAQSESRRALLGTDEWSIVEIGSKPVVAGTAPTLAFFDEGFVAGNGSCNRFRGGYTLTGEGLRIGKLASTMMACGPAAMDQEHALLQRLEATRSFDIRADGALVLKDGSGGTLVAVKKPKG